MRKLCSLEVKARIWITSCHNAAVVEFHFDLYYLLTGIKDVQADHAASHLGKAIGVATALRSTPFHGSKGKVYLPNDILIKHGVSHEDIIRGRKQQPVKEVTYELASLAHAHLSKAQTLISDAPKPASRAFLPMVSCRTYLTQIQKVDFDIFHPTLRERNHLLPLLLLKHAWTGLWNYMKFSVNTINKMGV